VLNPDFAQPEFDSETSQGWQPDSDFAAFDAEYGSGLEKGPRQARPSVCALSKIVLVLTRPWQDDPNEQWAHLDREMFLDELIRQDSRGDHMNQRSCTGEQCAATDTIFRCTDCIHPCLYCDACIVDVHRRMPLHHVEVRACGGCSYCSGTDVTPDVEWQFFQTLHPQVAGASHTTRSLTWGPLSQSRDDFVVINSHTIDEVGLDYCNCSRSKPCPIQLLRMCLYPATGTNPRSAATFAALDRFNLMSLESKCSAYEFYNSLARETDNTGLEPSRISTRF
jgi:hypothetical protein